MDLSKIKRGLMVRVKGKTITRIVPGNYVGVVEFLDGNYLKLTLTDRNERGPRWISSELIAYISDKTVHLNCTLEHFESQLLSNPPQDHHAVSAVTGGNPEDINEMPPDLNPDDGVPVYDGSQLGRSASRLS
jgi:hypothetical protein